MTLDQKRYCKEFSWRLSEEPQRGLFRVEFLALGTRCSVLFAAMNGEVAQEFSQAVTNWVSSFEGKYSRFLDTSLLSEINRQAGRGWMAIDEETEKLLALCDELHFSTRGLLDPSALPLIQLWDYRRQRDSIPGPEELETVRAKVGWAKVERRSGEIRLPEKGMALDFGGFGKEYAVDRVAALAQDFGIADALIDFGQDIHILGTPPDGPAWHIGLEDPRRPGSTWTGLALAGRGAVATSGDYLRNFAHEGVRYGHIIDARTGQPVRNGMLAVSVVAASCLEAGTLSTVSFVAGPKEGMAMVEANFGAEACFVGEAEIHQSNQFYEYMVQS